MAELPDRDAYDSLEAWLAAVAEETELANNPEAMDELVEQLDGATDESA